MIAGSDPRIVCGARCVWWDGIGKTVLRGPHHVPCCPHCGGVLFEYADEATWWAGIMAYELDGHSGYAKFIEWLRGQCFATHASAVAAYRASGGVYG